MDMKEMARLLELYDELDNEITNLIVGKDQKSTKWDALFECLPMDWIDQWKEGKISSIDLLVILSVRMTNLRAVD